MTTRTEQLSDGQKEFKSSTELPPLDNIETEQTKNGSSPEAVKEAVDSLASAYHENWRETRKQEDGSFEPRIKTTKDEAWVEAHGTDQVDIANTEYGDLPVDWQAENKAAAEVVVSILDKANGSIDLNDEAIRNKVGDEVHSAWLSRENNAYARGGDLDVPFEDLPKDEQDKDIDQVEIALKLFGDEKSAEAGSKREELHKRLLAQELVEAGLDKDGLTPEDRDKITQIEAEIDAARKKTHELEKRMAEESSKILRSGGRIELSVAEQHNKSRDKAIYRQDRTTFPLYDKLDQITEQGKRRIAELEASIQV